MGVGGHRSQNDEENKHLAFELRGEAGKRIAQQDAVVEGNQRNMQEQGGFRTDIGRDDVRRRGARRRTSTASEHNAIMAGSSETP